VLSAAQVKEQKKQKVENDAIMLNRLKRAVKFFVDTRNYDHYMGLEVSEIFPYTREELVEALHNFSP
jgi:hypothetical protein